MYLDPSDVDYRILFDRIILKGGGIKWRGGGGDFPHSFPLIVICIENVLKTIYLGCKIRI